MCDESAGGRVLDHQAATRRIFVLHLRLDADPAAGIIAGRIQHSHTNDAAHFASIDELVAFITAHIGVAPG